MKPAPIEVSCTSCGNSLHVAPWVHRARKRYFCDAECYLKEHATTPLICTTCGASFVPKNYSKDAKYCSRDCRPMHGKDNPNFGKRHTGLWQMPAERRLKMSEGRVGAGNPRWSGGSATNGKFQHQQYVRAWMLQNLPQACAECGRKDVDLHHIVPRRCFQPRRLGHFAQNLVLLCREHNIAAHWTAVEAMRARTPQAIPFADRLPPSILQVLEQGGSVSTPLPGCDYSPLGNLVEAVIRQAPPSDKAE